MTKKILSIVLTALIMCGVVYVISWAKQAMLIYPERHAKTCLVTITEIADRAVTEQNPEGSYVSAILGAEYIESHYPVGTVLMKDHPFAKQYGEERRKQIERITGALKAATRLDFGQYWSGWKGEFGSSKFERR